MKNTAFLLLPLLFLVSCVTTPEPTILNDRGEPMPQKQHVLFLGSSGGSSFSGIDQALYMAEQRKAHEQWVAAVERWRTPTTHTIQPQ